MIFYISDLIKIFFLLHPLSGKQKRRRWQTFSSSDLCLMRVYWVHVKTCMFFLYSIVLCFYFYFNIMLKYCLYIIVVFSIAFNTVIQYIHVFMNFFNIITGQIITFQISGPFTYPDNFDWEPKRPDKWGPTVVHIKNGCKSNTSLNHWWVLYIILLFLPASTE